MRYYNSNIIILQGNAELKSDIIRAMCCNIGVVLNYDFSR